MTEVFAEARAATAAFRKRVPLWRNISRLFRALRVASSHAVHPVHVDPHPLPKQDVANLVMGVIDGTTRAVKRFGARKEPVQRRARALAKQRRTDE